MPVPTSNGYTCVGSQNLGWPMVGAPFQNSCPSKTPAIDSEALFANAVKEVDFISAPITVDVEFHQSSHAEQCIKTNLLHQFRANAAAWKLPSELCEAPMALFENLQRQLAVK